jgi:hypothetical protein
VRHLEAVFSRGSREWNPSLPEGAGNEVGRRKRKARRSAGALVGPGHAHDRQVRRPGRTASLPVAA